MRFGEVKIVHRARDVEIAVGIKAVDKAKSLITQIAFNLKIGVKSEAFGIAVLQAAAKFLGKPCLRKISDVRGHTGNGETR